MDVCGNLNRDHFAVAGTIADRACREGFVGQSSHRFHRSDKLDQVRDVIRSHVQNRSTTGLEEKVRVRMPSFHPVSHHVAGTADDATGCTAVDRGARQLM